MALEIERKFLVQGNAWQAGEPGLPIRQGYLCAGGKAVVRVRTYGTKAFLTVKGDKQGFVRAEFEYSIPFDDAVEMLDTLCQRPLIEKTRYERTFGGRTWTIDVFAGDNAGLTLAEIELSAADERIELPPWAGREVTADPRFLNARLVERPLQAWPEAERRAILP